MIRVGSVLVEISTGVPYVVEELRADFDPETGHSSVQVLSHIAGRWGISRWRTVSKEWCITPIMVKRSCYAEGIFTTDIFFGDTELSRAVKDDRLPSTINVLIEHLDCLGAVANG